MGTEAQAIVDTLLENDQFQVSDECSWCNSEFGLEPTHGASHGICKRHYSEMMRQAGIPEDRIRAALSDPAKHWVPERNPQISAP
jgi:hypothetical protein